jgi:hypothetical protein
MFQKSIATAKSFIQTAIFRFFVFTILLILVVLGAGAPGATGV